MNIIPQNVSGTISDRLLGQIPQLTEEAKETAHQVATLGSIALVRQPSSATTAPLLSPFYAEELIPKKFRLKPEHEKIIQTLFDKWSLDNRICLIDLLGLELFDRIGALCGNNDYKTEVLHDFGATFLFSYLFLIRTGKDMGPMDKSGRCYFLDKQSIEQNLQSVLTQLSERKNREIDCRDLTPERKKIIKNQFKELIDTQVRPTLDLFHFLLKSDIGSVLLVDKNLFYFSGSEKLFSNQKNPKKHLYQYADYIQNLYNAAFKKQYIGMGLHFLERIRDELKTPHLETSEKLFEFSEAQKQLRDVFSRDYLLAQQGSLNHQQWLQQNGFSQAKRKGPREFIESLLQNIILADTSKNFAMDLQWLLEERVLRIDFPGYISMGVRAARFFSILSVCGKGNVPINDGKPARAILRREIGKIFSPFLRLFEHDVKLRESSSIEVLYPSTEPKSDELVEIAPMGVPRKLLDQFKEPMEAFAKLLKTIPKRRESLLSALDNELPMKQVDIEELRNICLEELLGICTLAILCRDADVFGKTGHFQSEFPPELADLIQLEGIEPLIARRTELPPSPRKSPESIFVEPPASVKEPRKTSPKPVISAPKSRAPVAVQPSPHVPEEPFTIDNRNVRIVLQKLKAAGFTEDRTTGGHSVYKINDQGPQVVVPTGKKDIPHGTAGSIEAQARVALSAAANRNPSPPLTENKVAHIPSHKKKR